MKKYSNDYEKFATCPKRLKRYCKIEDVSTFNNVPENTALYVKMYKDVMSEMWRSFFDCLVKFIWLTRKFCYKGKHRSKYNANGHCLDAAWGTFLRKYVGFDNRMIFTQFSMATKVASYMNDLFPFFDEGNPFEEKYEYPYKYVTLDFLYLVKDLPERMGLLALAEKNKMSYTEFLDYILNYIGKYNEEHGRMVYVALFDSPSAPRIKIIE